MRSIKRNFNILQAIILKKINKQMIDKQMIDKQIILFTCCNDNITIKLKFFKKFEHFE